MKILIGIFLLFLTCCLSAQTDSVTVKRRGGAVVTKDTTLKPVIIQLQDTAIVGIDTIIATDADTVARKEYSNFVNRFFKKNYPNPRKAALMSLVIPGSGQAYNRKYWKIPIVYGALGGVGWVEVMNIKNYKLLKTSYKALVDEDPSTVVTDPRLILMDATTLKANRDIAQKNLETSSLILAFTYLLSVTDAFVDAHLRTFDVSDDLSLKICPKASNTIGFGPSFGVGISITYDSIHRFGQGQP